MPRILAVIGTRPEVIKMAPILRRMREMRGPVTARLCVTAQHREMIDPLLRLFDLTPDLDLDVMEPGQTLPTLTSKVLLGMTRVLEQEKPACVLVQGDTTTVLAAALAAFYQKIPVAHVEAGLRTNNLYSPYPEEMNRRLTGSLAAVHFAPTTRAVRALEAEGVPKDRIEMTGNPVIDSLLWILKQPLSPAAAGVVERYGAVQAGRRMILVTAHRRESFGSPFLSICRGLRRIVERNADVEIVYPVHLNPNVRAAVEQTLAGHDRIHLLEPLSYEVFSHLMNRAYLILTDSGGVQEEGPALGKPVLVLREDTERPEAVEAGSVEVIGTDENHIVEWTERLLNDSDLYARMSNAVTPYGDGHAAERITDFLVRHYGETHVV